MKYDLNDKYICVLFHYVYIIPSHKHYDSVDNYEIDFYFLFSL